MGTPYSSTLKKKKKIKFIFQRKSILFTEFHLAKDHSYQAGICKYTSPVNKGRGLQKEWVISEKRTAYIG